MSDEEKALREAQEQIQHDIDCIMDDIMIPFDELNEKKSMLCQAVIDRLKPILAKFSQ